MSKKGRGATWFFLTSIMYVFLFHSNSFSYCHCILRPQIYSPSTPASLINNSTTRWEQDCNSLCNSFQSECEDCPSVFKEGEHHTMGTSSAAGRRGPHHSSELFVQAEDHREATYVRVRVFKFWNIYFLFNAPFSMTYSLTTMHTFATQLQIGRRSPSMASLNIFSLSNYLLHLNWTPKMTHCMQRRPTCWPASIHVTLTREIR